MLLYPFAAVVGMELAKRSLLLHAVDPRIGGTLLKGHRGCAKSTLARGFAALLPDNASGSAPFTEVPLGVSEDRLLGAVHAESLVRTGAWSPHPGLLESADGGVLYVDEINLLPDALADLLLDSAASGIHRQERDGISQTVHSRYILIGTMNPEEGDLRPQLSDRFAHGVAVSDTFSAEERVEIGRRRLAFDDDPEEFIRTWSPATREMLTRISSARARLLQVQTKDDLRLALARRARDHSLEGLRAELAMLRTARAAAALRGDDRVCEADLEEAWTLCIGHRMPDTGSALPPNNPGSTPPQSTPDKPSRAQAAGPGRPGSPAGPVHNGLSITPKDAMTGSIPLPPMQKPRILSIPQPAAKSRQMTAPMRRTARLATCRLEAGRVRWQASLLASLKNGWTPGAAGWRWIANTAKPARRLWALLDASRSTGAAGFLLKMRELLAGMLPSFKRVNILVIHDSRPEWLLRSGSAVRAMKALQNLPDARGRSPLPDAVLTLNRSLLAQRASSMDTVCVCSDGLPTLRSGETAARAATRLNSALRRLSRTLPNPILWMTPKPARGLSLWLHKVLEKTGVQMVGTQHP